jgi:hypothetical protein
MSVQSYGKAVPRAQKVNVSISQYYICEYNSERLGEVITTDFIDSFITDNFRLLYVPNKTPDLPNEKAFPNGMYPINVEKIDFKQVIEYSQLSINQGNGVKQVMDNPKSRLKQN